ncbi:MAG: shikimate kinase [Bacilli bacterium]
MGSYEAIVGEEVIKNFKRVIDLNYNPLNSKLKYLCYKNNVEYIGGIEMLIVQAIKSFEIFNQIKVSEEYIQKILVVVLKQLNLNIALIGMPLAGKSTICKKYNGVDIDDEISKNYKIEDLIKNESEFRKVEAQIIKGNLDKRFICLGGGAVKTAKNLELLKNHLIIFLDENLEVLENRYLTKVRPLLKSKEDVSKLYNERIKLYNNFCNIKFSYSKLEEFLNEYFNN